MHRAGDAAEELHGVVGTTQKTENLTNPATQRCVISAAEGRVGASRARSPCSNTRIIHYVVILALSAGATSPTVLATQRMNSRVAAPQRMPRKTRRTLTQHAWSRALAHHH